MRSRAAPGANGQGLSPIQQAQKDVSGEGGQALQPAPAPQLGMPNMHNQQVEAQAPQLMAALRTARRATLELGLAAIRLDGRPARRGAADDARLFRRPGGADAGDNLELDRWRLCLTIRSPTP